MSQDIIQIKLEIAIPKSKWLADLNKLYPDLTFNMLSKFLVEEKKGITLFQIEGNRVKSFLEDFKQGAKKAEYQVLYKSDDILLLNVQTKDPWILNALVKTRILLITPIKVKEGKIIIETITERENVDKFLEELEEKGINFHIKSIGYYHRSPILTDLQKETLKKVYESGYFEIPRKNSLTEIARELEISPSALSETLRRINRRLAENFLEGQH